MKRPYPFLLPIRMSMTDTTPAIIDARAPQMTRESTSRPFSSVPIQ